MVTVILPIFNEVKHIEKTINAILNQDFNNSMVEIIIADGISNDGTREKLNNYENNYPNIILIDNPDKIVPAGFNRALTIAKGDIIIRVDGHTILEPDYISKCVDLIKEKNVANVGGPMNVIWEDIFDGVVAIATSSKFGIGNAAFHYSKKGQYVDTVYLGAWKKSIFDKVGGFDQELVRNQDDEFNFRLIQAGEKIWLDPQIKSKYHPRNSITKLFKQYFQYGFYKVRVAQKRRGISSLRQLIPAFFVFTILVSIVMLRFSFLPIIFSLGTYTIANFFMTILNVSKKISSEELKNRNDISRLDFFIKSVFYLPVTYFTLHFSYGLGYLSGLLYFVKKWGSIKLEDNYFVR